MEASKHNIIGQLRDSDDYYIVNLLSGQADIVEKPIAEALIKNQPYNIAELSEKAYWVDNEKERKNYNSQYLQFVEDRDKDETQIFFVPWYACNFACSYCYQDEYAPKESPLTTDIIDAFFKYIEKHFAGQRKYITLFGGEPLLSGSKQRELIEYFFDKASQSKISLCVVTNGYNLHTYIDVLKRAVIREVQVTLDGTAQVHNSRRFLKGGQGSFEQIVKGVDACLDNGLAVNMRVVADKDNINNLPELSQYAIDKGWTSNPLFKTQIGRNYELHHCQSSPDRLFTRVSLYEKLYELIKINPHILQFYKPSFSVSKYLTENGELPAPLFDSCPACKTEWAFDYTGTIYPCTATVGKSDEILGTFYPTVTTREAEIENWQERDVTTIEQCRSCNLQLACGGGCGSVAKNRMGNVLSPDCRPITELLGLGFKLYV